MDYRKALKQIKAKVTSDFIGAPNPKLLFHNLDHTEKVVSRSGKIGKHYKLEHEPFFILLAAAWFHDIGYLYGKCKGHQNRSAEIAGTYLAREETSSQLIEAIKNTIITASAENQSDNLLARILYDADLYHLGTNGFFKQNKLVKKEREWESGEKIPKQDWRRQTIDFLETHHFQTDYCQQKLESKKQKNLEKLKDKMMTAAAAQEGTETKMGSGTEKKKLSLEKSAPSAA
jgi:predicted metal-dependent HD superfamily phosphohydrolase